MAGACRESSGKGTILLVDDSPTDIFVINEVIEKAGVNLNIRVAKDGQEALSYLAQLCENAGGCPALVLLDLNLPKVSGIEVLQRIRSGSRCNQMPVIIVTSSSAEADRAAAQRLGAEGYFQKPHDLTAYMELAKIIRRVLKS